MPKCIKCESKLEYNENEQLYCCPNCGSKYKVVSNKTPEEPTEPKEDTTTDSEPQSLYEQLKSEIKQNKLIKPKWIIYLIAVALIITCICVFATPISYNTRFVYNDDNNYYDETSSIIFQRNNIYKSLYGSKTSHIALYYLEDNNIVLNNKNVLKIINRTTLQNHYGEIYKAVNIGEIFLIIITVSWGIFAIVYTFIYNKKKNDKKESTKEQK